MLVGLDLYKMYIFYVKKITFTLIQFYAVVSFQDECAICTDWQDDVNVTLCILYRVYVNVIDWVYFDWL